MAMQILARLCSLISPGKCKLRTWGKPLAQIALALFPLGAWANTSAPIQNPAHAPQRIISLAPHVTELIYAAGAGHYLVGTVRSSDYPPAATTLPKVGDGLHIDPETIVSLQPDLVLGWQTGATQSLAPILESLNIPLVHINPKTLRDIPHVIQEIGRLTGTHAQASKTAASIRQRLHSLRHLAPETPIKVVLEINPTPLYVIGNEPLLNDALSYCNATNPFESAPQAAPLIGLENLLTQQPDVIVVRDKPTQATNEHITYLARRGVDAAQQNKIIRINPDLLFRPGPRLVDAIEQLCAQLKTLR